MDDASSMSSSTLRLKPKGKNDPANRASSRKHAEDTASRPVTVLSDSRMIQTLSAKDNIPLVINPPEVRFDNVESDVRYVMTISVQNNTTTAQRIRFQSPKTSYFTINYIPSGAIAPGLDARAEIECQLPEKLDEFLVSDSIVVLMGPHKVEVPLYARLPCPDIIFDPFLNLGLVVEGQSVSPSIVFENRGAETGRISFKKSENSQITIDPTRLELAPRSKASVVVHFDGKSAGPVRELIQVQVEGVRSPMTLDVGGSVVPQKLSLLSAKGGVLEEVDFGTIFFGQEREVEALLINNGPQQVNYSVVFPEDTAATAASDASTGTAGTAPATTEPAFERCVSIHPSDGTLNPFAQIVLKIKFHPVAPTPEKGFSSKYIEELAEPIYLGARAVIDAFDMNQSVPLAIAANAVMPTYKLSPTMLRFGECPVYDRRDILMTLVNTSPIALSYDFTKVAQFKITPSSGSLGPAQTKSIVASFTPAQLGEIKKAVQFSVEGGLRHGEIRLFGVSSPSDTKKVLIGGIDKVPEDFKTNFKFVDPSVVARELTALHQSGYKREAPWESTVFEPSNSWDEIYESTVKGRVPGPPRFVNNDNPTYSLQQLQKRAEHKQHYNDFLQQSHAQRIKKRDKMAKMKATKRGLTDRSDYEGVDMGMERGLDDGPVPRLPPANEPLWLANGNKQSEGGHSFLFDEDRLIVKKQKEGPSTQAELRDCSSELTPDELRRVTYSHKILNFGKVCVNSVNVKNFAVTNELQHNVIVKLGTLELELRQSKPISQIAPPSSMIGFDMTFVCREVCKYKKSFSYTVNDVHNFKVTVLADVVPIELVLDKKELKMEFSESSLDRSHVEKVAVSNPGNAVAEYMWSNAGAFKCTPEQGTIAPGGAMVTTVTWTPTPAISSNTEELGLLVTGGTQQSLLVTGVLPETKLVFEEKKLSLGTIAVGDEKTYTLRVKNVGSNPAVFHFEEPSPNAYITIKPMRGKVPVGEVFEVDVIVHPRAATSFDNKSLTASVRGGKNIGVKLSGDAIVPKVELTQKAFQFGSVVTGSRVRLPLTLTNSSAIDATMTLDLSTCNEIRPTFDTSDAMDETTGLLEEDNHGNAILQLEGTVTYKITLKPNTTCSAFLAFSPTTEKSVNFRMPLYLKGITEDKSFVRQISGEALKSRLKVSSYVVDFADRVVSRDPASRMTYFKEITFKNIDTSGLSYEIREVPDAAPTRKAKEGEVASPVFFVSPMQCNLSPGESNAIRVTFLPQSHGDFSKVLEIYVENQPDPSRPYFTVTCKGSGVYPRLTFSRHSLVLPTVPLSVPSRTTCHVINMGYDNIDLKYRVSPVIPIPITVQFPEGAELGLTRDKVPIIITAKAESPVSWSGKIEFYDPDGEKFYLEISGCADNCLFVNYPFVGNYVDRYGFVALDDQPIRLATKNQIVVLKSLEIKQKAHQRKLKAAEASAKEGDAGKKTLKKMPSLDVAEAGKHVDEDEDEGVDPARPEIDAARMEADVILLLKWLNVFICRKPFDTTPGRFPETITDVQGDSIIECIELMSGKKIPAVPPAKVEEEHVGGNSNLMNKLTAIGKITAKYKNLLLFLIKSGALLLHINPIQLLGHDECLLSREMDLKREEGGRLTVAMLKERRSIWSAEWRRNCHAGWSQILFQAFKTYILSRITYHEYENTPGVVVQSSVMDAATEKKEDKKKKKKKETGPKAPPELQASNVYSHSESVLLAWAAYHSQRAGRLVDEGGQSSSATARMPSLNRRIVDLQQEFFDFFSFCQIIHSHLPDAALTNGPLCGYSFTDSAAKDKNFNRMRSALSLARMDFDESIDEITNSARGMMLMLTHMFLNLPSLIPKTTIEFKGTLGAPILKTIELKNPSKRRVAYDVTLEGGSEFTIGANSAVLPPLSETEFVVTCTPHFSKAAKARLTFWGVREGGSGGTNIVFDLVSNVTDRRPQGSIKKNVALFETEKFEVTVTNPFDKACTFPVVLVQTHTPTSGQQQNAAAAKSQRNKSVVGSSQAMAALLSEVSGGNVGAPKPKTEEDDAKKIVKEPFWCSETSITLGPHESGKLNLQAVPFSVGTYNCQVVLMEPTVGEFAYEVIMTVTPPNPIDSLSFQCNQGTSGVAIQKILKIASANSHFEHAVAHVTDSRLPMNKRGKVKQALFAIFASPVSNEETGQSQFAIEMSSPYFNVQKEFGLVAGGIVTGGSVAGRPGSTNNQKKYQKVAKCTVEPYTPPDGASQAMINAVPFSFFAEKPGVYKTRAVIYSLTNNLDMRVLDLCATVTPSETSMTLEFHGAARQKITQEIPVHNESETDWNLTAIVSGQGFSSPKTIFVAKGDKVMFPVSFSGPYAGQFKGTLILRNPQSDKDSFEFQLKGSADDPLAEQHLKFKCKARNRQSFTIPIPAVPSAPPVAATGRESRSASQPRVATTQLFNVETDLPYVSGEPQVEVGSNGGEYEFSVYCPIGGVMSGSITFADVHSNQMIWYTVDIDVTSPVAESTIEVQSEVRKAVVVEITLDNPTKENLEFQVSINGAGLLGDSSYTLTPSGSNMSTGAYELIYSPLMPGKSVGSISFVNDKIGEFWYRVSLEALPAQPTVLDTIECMIGSTATVQVPVENPLPEAVTFEVQLSDKHHFSVYPESVHLGPYAQATFDLSFHPSSLSEEAHTDVILSHPNLGDTIYKISGMGLLPGIMPPIQIYSAMKEITSHTILFRNPFSHPLPIDIFLHDKSSDAYPDEVSGPGSVFSLLLRKSTGIVLAPESSMQVGLSFSPERLGEYQALAEFRSTVQGRNLLWCYPIIGLAEAGVPQKLPKMVTACKSSLLKEVEIALFGLKRRDFEDGAELSIADLSCEIVVHDKQFKSLVNRAFRIQPIAVGIVEGNPQLDYCVRYRLLFEPLKVFTADVEIVVVCKNKGRWKADITLDAEEPPADDILRLCAPVGGVDRVSFRLTNRFLGYSPLQAYFTARSSPHFSVSPSSGVLAPFGSAEGTQFVVTFSPKEYGMREVAYLVISTDEAQWNYEIHGSYPEFNVKNIAIKSKIDSRR